jgi:hypothetical protein
MDHSLRSVSEFLIVLFGLVIALFGFSNLLPTLLRALVMRLSAVDFFWTALYATAAVGGIFLLSRAIYRIDRGTGRIRNKMELFE